MAAPDTDIKHAADYIKAYVAVPGPNSVADLLFDGHWCGHGETMYRVYDILEDGNTIFNVELPDTESEETFPIAVKLSSVRSRNQFLVYDTRKHPASWHAFDSNARKQSKYSDVHHCGNCSGTEFKVSVGFEVPEDSGSPNDTSWFALATECMQCGDKTLLFDDETA